MRRVPFSSSITVCIQSADGESNRIVSDKKKTDTAWMFDTYRVRNHLVPNPINSKLKRLKIKKI